MVIDCVELAEKIKADNRKLLAGKKALLKVILVGNDSASQVYVRNKTKVCNDCGIDADNVFL